MSQKSISPGDEFDRALTVWLDSTAERPDTTESELRRLFGEAWKDRRASIRAGVLIYLSKTVPDDGLPIVNAALMSRNPTIRRHALTTTLTYARSGAADAPGLERRVARIAEDDEDADVRWLALLTLTRLSNSEHEDTLRRILRSDSSPKLRLEAGLALLRRGFGDVLPALVRDFRTDPQLAESSALARHICDEMNLELQPEDRREVARLADRAIETHRARLHDRKEEKEDRAVSALFISRFARPTRAETDIVGRLAVTATTPKGGVIAVNALAEIGTKRAYHWLNQVRQSSKIEEARRRAESTLSDSKA